MRIPKNESLSQNSKAQNQRPGLVAKQKGFGTGIIWTMQASRFVLMALCCFVVLGCNNRVRTRNTTKMPDSNGEEVSEGLDAENNNNSDNEEDGADKEPVYETAAVGADDAKKGSSYGGGIITEPLHQSFHAADRIEFIKIAEAMKIYKAFRGFYPRTHEEFMKEIIQENSIQLPELKEGWEYFYDKEDHTLKQRRENK